MTGADTENLLAGISENLEHISILQDDMILSNILLSQNVPEARNGVLRVLDELVLGLVTNVLWRRLSLAYRPTK